MQPLVRAGFVLIIGYLALVSGGAAETGRTVLAKGLFSFQAPPGWTVSDLAVGYPIARGPSRDGFTPNIRVGVVTNPEPLAKFVDGNLAGAANAGITVANEEPFWTDAGLDGMRVVLTVTVSPSKLQQIFYFFDAGANRKITISATCLAKDGATDAPVFDASLKTFSLE